MNEIAVLLTTEKIGRKLIFLDLVDSTNNYAKKHGEALPDGTVIVAREQTAGRGRMGRKWVSPVNKGIFMTIILKPLMSASALAPLTQIAAAAVISSLDKLGITADIKWPNDILLGEKKVCGILTESNVEEGVVKLAAVGIGINDELAEEDIPLDLKENATSLYLETGSLFCRQKLIAETLNVFESFYERYIIQHDLTSVHRIAREKSAVIGRKVSLSQKPALNEWQEVWVEDIAEDGSLIISDQAGKISRVMSGEISLRVL